MGRAEPVASKEAVKEVIPAMSSGPSALSPHARDVSGLHVESQTNGTIHVRGKDRWGQKIDIVYESPSFFKNAVPVLARSVTPGQAEGLNSFAQDLP